METLRLGWDFVRGSCRTVTHGGRAYWIWTGFLVAVLLVGVGSYAYQLDQGLISSNMRDQLSWGMYIGNFAFMVGVAASAVVLVIPAYVYSWGPLREVVLVGELLAVAAILMCIGFVTVDIGHPERLWHLFPLIGNPNFPYSLLVWDILSLSAYLLINWFIVTYLVFKAYIGQAYNPRLIMPVIFLSIPLAIAIHTVTAFLFMGLSARPFWNTAILAPRFLASAFCSGPALLVLILLVLRQTHAMRIPDAALHRIGEFLAYAMGANLFFLGSEAFREFYSASAHVIHAEFQWLALDEGHSIANYTWFALTSQIVALVIFLVRQLRQKLPLLAIGCFLASLGVYIEKGLGLLLPGMTPDVLGEVYHYAPSAIEMAISSGIWAMGALLFTWMLKVSLAVSSAGFRAPVRERTAAEAVQRV